MGEEVRVVSSTLTSSETISQNAARFRPWPESASQPRRQYSACSEKGNDNGNSG